jgi:hypothetical protein
VQGVTAVDGADSSRQERADALPCRTPAAPVGVLTGPGPFAGAAGRRTRPAAALPGAFPLDGRRPRRPGC